MVVKRAGKNEPIGSFKKKACHGFYTVVPSRDSLEKWWRILDMLKV
jgi:hypothetical protein